MARIEHGFSIANIIMIVVLILILWGIRYGATIVPQVRATADKVVRLNDLESLDLNGKVGGCIPWNLKGNL